MNENETEDSGVMLVIVIILGVVAVGIISISFLIQLMMG